MPTFSVGMHPLIFRHPLHYVLVSLHFLWHQDSYTVVVVVVEQTLKIDLEWH